MDNMPAGTRYPQEDEFALLAMGAPTPYRHLAFCNQRAPFLEMLNFRGARARDVERVRRCLVRFYKSVMLRTPGRIVVKSPTHTGRIASLANWFPGARFIHISRHPYRIFPSTVNLWRSLAKVQGFQIPSDDPTPLEKYVHECYERMYEGYFGDRGQVPPGSLVEIRYEDLVADPVETMRQVYESVGLGEFERVAPRMETFWSERKHHRGNRIRLDEEMQRQIDARWSSYMNAFGYEEQTVGR
jgi:hypothetical protein